MRRGSPCARSRSGSTAAPIPRRRPRSRRRTSRVVERRRSPSPTSSPERCRRRSGHACSSTPTRRAGLRSGPPSLPEPARRDRDARPVARRGGRNPRFGAAAAPALAARRRRAVDAPRAAGLRRGRRASSTAGSRSHFRGDPVVDRAEHRGAEHERDDASRRRGRRGSPVVGTSPSKSGARKHSTTGVSGLPHWIRSTSHGWLSAPGRLSRL